MISDGKRSGRSLPEDNASGMAEENDERAQDIRSPD
jgi:hypothetical protein